MGPRHPVKPEAETSQWRRQRREREKDVEEKARILAEQTEDTALYCGGPQAVS